MEDSHDDIIELNVGGKIMTTKRSTLCQIDGSLLATMFSGRWEGSMSHDKDGRVFLDFNPVHFGFILNYLREKIISSPDNPATLPKVPSNEVKMFSKLVEYLGLSSEMLPQMSESFKEHSQGIKLEENGTVAAFYSQEIEKSFVRRSGKVSRLKTKCFTVPENEFVFGQNIYEDGIIRLQFGLNLKVGSAGCKFKLGMVPSEVTPEQISTCYNGETFFHGWTMNWSLGGISVYAQTQSVLFNLPTFSGTLVLELILDCNSAMLFLRFSGGYQHHLIIPRWNSWRFLVKLQCIDGNCEYQMQAISMRVHIQSKKIC